jgi:hypothetical protein
MNDRARAIAILTRARDILAERLTERVLEVQEELLADAQGDSYLGEIEALYEQFGLRLHHLNTVLGSLPAIEEPAAHRAAGGDAYPANYEPPDARAAPPGPPSAAPLTMIVQPGAVGPAASGEPTLLAVQRGQPAPSFQTFAVQITAGNLETAAATLAELLEMDLPRAMRCAARFQEQMQASPDFLSRAMRLRYELSRGSVNGAMMLLWECFGLQGAESIAALQALRARL